MAKVINPYTPYEYVYFDISDGKFVFIKDTTILRHSKTTAPLLLGSEVLKGVDRLKSTYAPDQTINIFTGTDGLKAYNSFVPSKLVKDSKKSKEIPETVEFLIRHLISNDELYEIFINALAYHLQSGQAIHLGWVFAGIEGSGKGTLLELLSMVFGQHNVAHTSLNSFTGDKIKGVPDKLISHCDETMDKTKSKEVVNNMKKIIGNDWYASRALHQDEKGVKNWTMFFFTVNSFDFILSSNDRRMNVIDTPKKLTDAVKDIDQFRKKYFAEVQAFTNYLMGIKVDVPMTRRIVKTAFREKSILGNLDMVTKIATAITTFNLYVFEDELNRSDEQTLKEIEDIEDKLGELAFGADIIKGSLINGLINDIYKVTNYKEEWKHPLKVSALLKEKWLYKSIRIKKKTYWVYILSEGKDFLEEWVPFKNLEEENKKVTRWKKKIA